jgi:hypothetical protein
MSCRFPAKRTFATRDKARAGAELIRQTVESQGGVYQTLYPYRCPENQHWHLSHYQQGYAVCSWCVQRRPAFKGGDDYWVLGNHRHDGHPCGGSGSTTRVSA